MGLFPLLDLAADGGELLLGKPLRKGETRAIGGQEGLVLLLFIDGHQGGGVVDGGDLLNIIELGQVHKAQAHQGHGGNEGAHHDKRGAAALFTVAAVGNSTEQRQQEQGQHIVQSHDDAGPGLGHTEFIGENQGDGIVVGLPKGADQEKGKAHQNRPLVV